MIQNGQLISLLEKSFSFWDKISDLEKAALMDNISDIKYEKGTCLSGSDDSCAGVFLIRSGTLRVYMLSEDGKDLTLFRLNPGEICILSASCVLKLIRFEVLIEAETECRILVANANFSLIWRQEMYGLRISHTKWRPNVSPMSWKLYREYSS